MNECLAPTLHSPVAANWRRKVVEPLVVALAPAPLLPAAYGLLHKLGSWRTVLGAEHVGSVCRALHRHQLLMQPAADGPALQETERKHTSLE